MKKLILLGLTLFMTISFVISGITLAFFSDQASVGSSIFEMGSLSLTSVNTDSGVEDPKDYVKNPSWTVQNTGTMNLTLRVKVLCEWTQNLEVEANHEPSNVQANEPTNEPTNNQANEPTNDQANEPTNESTNEISNEAVTSESENFGDIESRRMMALEISSENEQASENELVSENEETTENESVSENETNRQPMYRISLAHDLWTQEENGWYTYRNPVLPNETIHVNALIEVNSPDWEGALELYFEAEAREVTAGGDYD